MQVQAAVCSSEYNVGTLSVFSVANRRRVMITLNLGDSGVPVPFQIDSGSECCVLPRHEYVRVTGDRSLAKLRPVKTVIVTYSGTRWVSVSVCGQERSETQTIFQRLARQVHANT